MAWNETVSQKDGLKAFKVVTANGGTDVEASCNRFREALIRSVADQESDDVQVLSAIHQLFDNYRGANLNLDYIKSQAASLLAKANPNLSDPRLHSMLTKRVEDVLHVNCNQPAREAKGSKPAREAIVGHLFSMRKGQNGGFSRDSDQVHDTIRP